MLVEAVKTGEQVRGATRRGENDFFGKLFSYADVEITGQIPRQRGCGSFICIRTREIVNKRSHPPERNNVTRLPVRHWHVHALNGLEPARRVATISLFLLSFD